MSQTEQAVVICPGQISSHFKVLEANQEFLEHDPQLPIRELR